jgi:hypothetical protein
MKTLHGILHNLIINLPFAALFLFLFVLSDIITTIAFVHRPIPFCKSRFNYKIVVRSPRIKMSNSSIGNNNGNNIQLASVESLDSDHEMEGSKLSASIAAWLDQEVSLKKIRKAFRSTFLLVLYFTFLNGIL